MDTAQAEAVVNTITRTECGLVTKADIEALRAGTKAVRIGGAQLPPESGQPSTFHAPKVHFLRSAGAARPSPTSS